MSLGTVMFLLAAAQGDAALATAIAGRTAGPPTTCIQPRFIRRSRVIDGTAIIYEMSPTRWYVQRPAEGAEQLRSGDVIVSRSPTASLCRHDTADLQDSATRTRTGFVVFDAFVPYDRKKGRP